MLTPTSHGDTSQLRQEIISFTSQLDRRTNKHTEIYLETGDIIVDRIYRIQLIGRENDTYTETGRQYFWYRDIDTQ